MKNFNHKLIDFEPIEAITTESGRVYKTPAGLLPSATTVLSTMPKPALDAWKKRVGEAEAQRQVNQASLIGDEMHQLCEDYLWNKEVKPSGFITRDLFNQQKKLLDKHVDDIVAIEPALYSEFLKVAGRVDLIAHWDGRLSIIDFKNSKDIKKPEYLEGYYMQVAAYAVMFEELTGIPVQQTVLCVAHQKTNNAIAYKSTRDDHIQKFIELRKDFD